MNFLKIVLLCLLLVTTPSTLQPPLPTPLYAVNYGTSDGTAYVTTFYSDQTVQTHQLPKPLFVHYDSSIVPLFPHWDGHTLYGVAFESGEQFTESAEIIAFDALTTEFSTVVALPRGHSNTQVIVDSASPDGRYLWAFDTYFFTPYLVDLRTHEIVYQQRCRASVIAWFPKRVLLGNHQFGQGDICAASLFTQTLPPSTDEYSYPAELTFTVPPPYIDYPTSGITLSDDRVLIGLNRFDWSAKSYWDGMSFPLNAPVGLVDIEGQHVQYWGVGHYLSISDDEQFASFVSETGEIMRVDLTTLQVEQVGQTIYDIGFPYWERNTLHFWQSDGETISRVEITGSQRSEHIIYTVVEEDSPIVPPRGRKMAVVREGKLMIYPREAGENSSTNEAIPLTGSIPDVYTGPAWSTDGRWVHFYTRLFEDTLTESVNLETGEHVIQPGLKLVSDAPDGAWWLYSLSLESKPDQDRLVAYHPESGRSITLLENVTLGEAASFHLPPRAFYTWSQLWPDERP